MLVHPRWRGETAEDLEEVRMMIDAGETEIAFDELRWLLSDCAENIGAHVLLGELAAEKGDFPLARGHYGAGYQLGLQTLRRAKFPKPLLYSQPANQTFFEAGAGSLVAWRKSANLKWRMRLSRRSLSLIRPIRWNCVRWWMSCAPAGRRWWSCSWGCRKTRSDNRIKRKIGASWQVGIARC